MIRALAITLFVFLTAFTLGSLLALQQASDSRVVNQTLVDKNLSRTTEPSPSSSSALNPDQSAAPDTTTSANLIETYRQEALKDLVIWCGWGMSIGAIAASASLYFINAHGKSYTAATGSPQALRNWLLCLVFMLLALGILAITELSSAGQNLYSLISPDATLVCSLAFVLLQLVGYYLSTALGVSVTMRVSVPLANFFIRHRGR